MFKRIHNVFKFETYSFFRDKKYVLFALLALIFSLGTCFAAAGVFPLFYTSNETFEEVRPYYEEQRDIYYYGYMLVSGQITIDEVPDEIKNPIFPLEIDDDYEAIYYAEYTKYQFLIDNELVIGIDVLNYISDLSPMKNFLSSNFKSGRNNNVATYHAMQFTLFSFFALSLLGGLLSYKLFLSKKEERTRKNVFMSKIFPGELFAGKYILYSLILLLITVCFLSGAIIIAAGNIEVGLLINSFTGWKAVSIVSVLLAKYILYFLTMLALPLVLLLINNKLKERKYFTYIIAVGIYVGSIFAYKLLDDFIFPKLYQLIGVSIDNKLFMLFPIINVQYEWYGFHGFQFYLLALILLVFMLIGNALIVRREGSSTSINVI